MQKDVYYSNQIGNNNRMPLYDDPIKVNATITRQSNAYMANPNGIAIENNLTIVLDFKDCKFLSNTSVFFIDVDPNKNFNNFDYKISDIFERDTFNDKITLILKPNDFSESKSKIYFEYKNKIFETNVVLDRINKAIIKPRNMYLPIDTESKVWLREPNGNLDVNNLVKIVKIIETENLTTFSFNEV